MTLTITKNDGSNGYNVDNWGYRITNGDLAWYKGGFATREKAVAAGKRHLKTLKTLERKEVVQ